MQTPNYALIQDVMCENGGADPKRLPAGSYVRPIEFKYVPKHITSQHRFFDEETSVFCYTRYGIIPIARNLLRQT